MPRSFPLLTQLFLGLNGILTVACLDCCAFEPLVGGSNQSVSVCEYSDRGESSQAPAPDGDESDCSCQSCCAVSSPTFVFHAGASGSPELPVALPEPLIGLSPQPRYPPPRPASLQA